MKHIPPIRREYLLSSFYIYWNPGSIEMSTRVLTDLHWALNIYMRKSQLLQSLATLTLQLHVKNILLYLNSLN